MPSFVNNPPAAAQQSGGGILDSLFDFASKTFQTWTAYDNSKFEQQLREEQFARNPYGYYPGTDEYNGYTGLPTTLDTKELLLFGLLGVGAILLIKAIK